MTLIVVHGAESTGKTTLGRELASAHGGLFLPEFGRTWCEIFGTDCTAEDLVEIGQYQQRNIEEALADRPFVISDTDSLMTAAWAEMMLGAVPPELLGARKADLYLHCAIDVPFVDDGLRIFGNPVERQRFDSIARQVLEEAGVRVLEVSGNWDHRLAIASAAVEELLSAAKA
ncbi:ATP-binding protein [Sphingomonas sp. HDW15A]|uniref:AAA family ATPase n=1 Tax=Sphingomonas sp. HDW15A TaxID=2714942 RepID=UPI0014097A2C|nr:ATP-binding protein [Sphingomonas sp. HDW15A]QIK95662.1 ATP-binding protein [Sphingomonas sp. HDW15A]